MATPTKIKAESGSMSNSLLSAKELAVYDHCCGIHGAARERKGIKHAAVTKRRRLEKELVRNWDKEF
jgi:hypothetical protein